MSLPSPWVDRLFQKLSVTYGQAFLRLYDGVPIEDVKANWAEELSCFQQSPDAIRYGLGYLPPSKAPTVLEFRDLCRKAPSSAFGGAPALPAPPSEPPSPEVVAQTRAAFRSIANTGSRAWARELQKREACGKGLTKFQREAWREALQFDQETA